MYTLCIRPKPRYRHTALLPPAEKNGNVTPMTGRSARHMPIFETDCKAMSPKKPKHMQRPRSSLAFDAIYSTRRRYNNNNTMMAVQPMKPSSSPTTEKIKSLCWNVTRFRHADR